MKTYLFILLVVLIPLSVQADKEAEKKAGKVERPTREEVLEYFKVTKTGDLLKLYVNSYKAMLGEQYPELGDAFFGDPDFDKALRQLKKTKILVVGGGWGGDRFRQAAEQVVGVMLPMGRLVFQQ